MSCRLGFLFFLSLGGVLLAERCRTDDLMPSISLLWIFMAL